MTTQKVAQVFGWVFLVVGVLGFLPIAIISGTMGMEPTMMLGLFPVNVVQNVVHLAFGIWGIMAAKSADGAGTYCKIGGVIYLLIGAMGLVTGLATGFGLVPLGGNNVYLHLLLGAVLAYFGFAGGGKKA